MQYIHAFYHVEGSVIYFFIHFLSNISGAEKEKILERLYMVIAGYVITIITCDVRVIIIVLPCVEFM